MKTLGKTMRFKYNELYFPLVTLLVLGFMIAGNTPAFAQSGSAVSSVIASNGSPNIGDVIQVNININVSGVNAPNNLLGGYTGTLNWNAAVLSYQSHSGAPPTGFTGSVNTGSTGTGLITFNGANAAGTAGNTAIISINFQVVGSGSSTLDLAYSAMSAANTFNSLTGILTVNDGQVIVASPAGISYIGDIGSNTIKDSGIPNLVITTTAAVAAGNDIIIAYATDPSQDLTIAVSDAAGNKYQQSAMSISSGNLRTYIFAAYNVNALAGGSAITITQTVVQFNRSCSQGSCRECFQRTGKQRGT